MMLLLYLVYSYRIYGGVGGYERYDDPSIAHKPYAYRTVNDLYIIVYPLQSVLGQVS